MKELERSLSAIARFGFPDVETRSDATEVRAIIRLAAAERTWYIVGARRDSGGTLELMGYDPGCRFHSPGDGWFVLQPEFFETTAEVTADTIACEILPKPVALSELPDPLP